MKSTLFRIVALVVIFSMLVSPVNAMKSTPISDAFQTTPPQKRGNDPTFVSEPVELVGSGIVIEEKGATGPETYLVRLADEPLAGYTGGFQGLAATSPSRTGQAINLNSAASQTYLKYLQSKRSDFKTQAEKRLARSLKVTYEYSLANNGLAARMTPAEAAIVAQIPGVVLVQRNFKREIQTDNGPKWIGADTLWSGVNSPSALEAKGEGVVIGVIDTGINYSNPSFAATGPIDKYVHNNPLGTGFFLGDCAAGSTNAHAYCNDKLIGVRGYISKNFGDPVDTDGHGSHTASTAGGNLVEATIATTTFKRTISGVAPHANIIAYAACCEIDALAAAIDDILKDYATLKAANPNVRMVVNYSIGAANGSPSLDPWTDWDTVGFLNARDAGIMVANSAGNSGPNPATLGSPADSPWIMAVAASTHDRVWVNKAIGMAGGVNPPADIFGKGLSIGYGPEKPIVYAGDYAANNLCLPFLAGTFHGEIVVCDRGSNARVEKGANVLDAGAGGMILANDVNSGNSLVGDVHKLPAVHITYADGVVLKAWLKTEGSHTGAVSGANAVQNAAFGDVMASFSSRGPNRSVLDHIVPSISAPGVDILAAYGTDIATNWDMISGTSMASPHMAGASALMLQNHPDWTPAEIQSAMMTTSQATMLKQDGITPADPFDMGAGRVDLTKAAKAGLVLNETKGNYLAADPSKGGNVKALNLAQFGNSQCLSSCSWTRTLRNTLGVSATWTASVVVPTGMTLTVSPASFTVAAGAAQVITVTANVATLPVGVWDFGTVKLTEATALAPEAHFPVAVSPSSGVVPDSVVIETARDAGSKSVSGFKSLEITNLTSNVYGLAKGDKTAISINEDPTNANAYDDLSQVFWKTIVVPEGAKRIVAEVISSTAPDVDLRWGEGTTPSLATEIGLSAGGSWNEYLSMMDPAAGTYWVLMQDWDGALAPAAKDTIELVVAVVAGDESNLTVVGPETLPAMTDFEVTLAWDIPGMVQGDHYYGAFDLGTDPQNPGSIGTIPVDLIRTGDDVIKTVDLASAKVGDTLTYTISIQPNLTGKDLSYTISDPLPAGLTYVANSATNGATYDAATKTINWSGNVPALFPHYIMSTSVTDPECAWYKYIDLKTYGIDPKPNVFGDNKAYKVFDTGLPINFYGTNYAGLRFTDDGYALFTNGTADYGTSLLNTDLPDPATPNNIIGIDWRNWEVVYDQAATKGVSIASGSATSMFIEFDDIQPKGDVTHSMDMELYMERTVDNTPGYYEIVTTYDNINLTDDQLGTIGVENSDGTGATKFGYNNLQITNGMAVCYDWSIGNPAPLEITYQAVINYTAQGSQVVNTATHTTDDVYAKPAQASATTAISPIIRYFMPFVSR